ncbi:MAG: hypothetical protein E7329_00400 [Clostridiales bacterium]|nr:hypothetical protein [Clostridiales bacterium]
MNPLEAVQAARALLEAVTPLKLDCGRFCGGACCESDEDGQGGMLLFPGEEALYTPLPQGFSLERDDGVTEGALLLTCDGFCDRSQRPLSCRLFPMLPTRTGAKMDRRAWAVCPLMESGKAGLSKEFVEAVAKAGEILYACPAHAAFLDALHAYNEKLKEL